MTTTAAEGAGKTVAAAAAPKPTPSAPAPIVVDLGKKSRRQIRKVRKGTGKLMDKVSVMLDELRADGTIDSNAQPVLIVVRQRRRKNALGWGVR